MVAPYRILVVGMTQTGKTYWVKNYLLKLLKKDNYDYLIYDPDEEFNNSDGIITENVAKVPKLMDKNRWVVFRPSAECIEKPKKRVAEFEVLSKYILKRADANGRKIFFIVDELAYITLAKGKMARIPGNFQILIKRGMKRSIGVCATTQRLKDADVDYISQCQLVITFDCLPHDIKYLETKLPIKLPKITREGVWALNLEKYGFIIYNHEHRKIYKDIITKHGGDKKWVSPLDKIKKIILE